MSGPNDDPSPSMRVDPIGTRDITSTPPATATSYCPDITPATAKCTACCDEPHWRSMVTAGASSGPPAPNAAYRATVAACSATWVTHPKMTSSTTAGSSPTRDSSALRTDEDILAGCVALRPPPRLPNGVRTASTMHASRILCSFDCVGCARDGGTDRGQH